MVTGPVSRELDKVLAGTGYTWSIQDEQIILLSEAEVSGQEYVPLLTPSSGLIGSPEFGAPLVKGGSPQLHFRSLLNANIKPGAKVQVQCAALPLGVCQVFRRSSTAETPLGRIGTHRRRGDDMTSRPSTLQDLLSRFAVMMAHLHTSLPGSCEGRCDHAKGRCAASDQRALYRRVGCDAVA